MMVRAVVLAACALVSNAHAQGVPEQRLGQPDAEYREGLTSVYSVAELTGGRVIVVARDPRAPTLVDLRTGAAVPIGRRGQGPGEWSNITAVITLRGDTAILNDAGRRSLLRVVGDRVTGAGIPVHGLDVQFADVQGRVYYVGGGAIANAAAKAVRDGTPGAVSASDAVAGRRDSSAIVRENLGDQRADTLGYRRSRQGEFNVEVMTDRGLMAGSSPITGAMAQLPTDIVAFGRDGRVAIVRSPEYRVEWVFADGRRATSPPLPHQAVAGQPLIRSAMIAPTGELWVEPGRAADDSVPVLDIISPAGALVRRVRLPARTRLVGFGDGTVYLVRIDRDDLEYLQRYRLP